MNKLKKIMYKYRLLLILIGLLIGKNTYAQINLANYKLDYSKPKEFVIGGINVEGTKFLDHKTLIQLSSLEVGSKIMVPGDKLTKACRLLWEQGLFSDVQIKVNSVQGNTILFTLFLEERPRLSKFKFEGIKRSEVDAIRDKIKLARGKIITENVIINTKNIISDHFKEKGFLNIKTTVHQQADTITKNHVILVLDIEKQKKVKIGEINFTGNEVISDERLKRMMKDTKEKKFLRIFKASKFLKNSYKNDKEKIITKYNEKGLRDAKILSDSIVYHAEKELISINIKLNEGKTYFFGDISFVGNTKYSNKELSEIVSINKGDVFDQSILESRILGSPDSRDIHSIYLDNGYLFSQVTPVEIEIRNDTIDIEVRIYEGPQARVNRVSVSGNTKTNDHVIMREIRTKPGDLFSRSAIMRSQREIATLNYFDPEKLNIDVKPNQQDGTVDLNYIVEEKSSDQVELQGGYGADRIIGTFRVSFNNFSAKNIFKKGAWAPLPSGDGQRLSLSASSNGVQFQSYNISFTEPWMGGKKPNSLTVGAYHSITSNGLEREDPNRGVFKVTGASVGLGKRLKWPDDFFTLYQNLSLKNANAHVIDLSHIEKKKHMNLTGIIGYSVLKDYEIFIDLYLNQITLTKTDHYGNKLDQKVYLEKITDSIAFQLKKHTILLKTFVGKEEMNFALDSGAEINQLNTRKSKKVLSYFKPAKRIVLTGAANEKAEVLAGKLYRVKLNDRIYFGPMNTIITNLAKLSEAFGTSIDGVLGYEFFLQKRTIVNYKKEKLYFINYPLKN